MWQDRQSVSSSLANEGHDVIAIDNNQSIVNDISNRYDVIGVCGLGTDYETLSDANVESCDIFVAVTGSDELNMLSCHMAKTMGARKTIARIRNPEYNEKSLVFMQQFLNLSMPINPERSAARYIYNILKLPNAANVETFSTRNYEIVELKLKENTQLSGQKIMDIRKKYRANFLICAVQRGNDIFIPDGNFIINVGDKISLAAAPNEVAKLLKSLGIMQKQSKSVMILGASRTAYYLSKMLLSSGSSVKIIEKDPVPIYVMSRSLPGAIIIKGDSADRDLLIEEGLESVDAFISLTGMDEQNILLSYFAMQNNVPKVVTKINRNEFISVADDLGLDSVVSPWKNISDILVRYARSMENSVGSNVERLYKIMGGKAEALEFKVNTDFKYTNIPLKDIKFKKNILIAGIIRNRKAIIPSGDDVILAGDNVIVIGSGHRLYDLADIVE
ncbi:MAG: Trk system potassium transporter TrkA [Clostridia bacterium]|nr:Trk system potassium transporter TrkA [Clostridia bacterium]